MAFALRFSVLFFVSASALRCVPDPDPTSQIRVRSLTTSPPPPTEVSIPPRPKVTCFDLDCQDPIRSSLRQALLTTPPPVIPKAAYWARDMRYVAIAINPFAMLLKDYLPETDAQNRAKRSAPLILCPPGYVVLTTPAPPANYFPAAATAAHLPPPPPRSARLGIWDWPASSSYSSSPPLGLLLLALLLPPAISMV